MTATETKSNTPRNNILESLSSFLKGKEWAAAVRKLAVLLVSGTILGGGAYAVAIDKVAAWLQQVTGLPNGLYSPQTAGREFFTIFPPDELKNRIALQGEESTALAVGPTGQYLLMTTDISFTQQNITDALQFHEGLVVARTAADNVFLALFVVDQQTQEVVSAVELWEYDQVNPERFIYSEGGSKILFVGPSHQLYFIDLNQGQITFYPLLGEHSRFFPGFDYGGVRSTGLVPTQIRFLDPQGTMFELIYSINYIDPSLPQEGRILFDTTTGLSVVTYDAATSMDLSAFATTAARDLN